MITISNAQFEYCHNSKSSISNILIKYLYMHTFAKWMCDSGTQFYSNVRYMYIYIYVCAQWTVSRDPENFKQLNTHTILFVWDRRTIKSNKWTKWPVDWIVTDWFALIWPHSWLTIGTQYLLKSFCHFLL